LMTLQERGCHLFLWSSCGSEYAHKVAERHRLAGLFEGFVAKPDIVIDDMPSTTVAPFTYDVQQEGPWADLARMILIKHVDP
jgi:hypothetical protein